MVSRVILRSTAHGSTALLAAHCSARQHGVRHDCERNGALTALGVVAKSLRPLPSPMLPAQRFPQQYTRALACSAHAYCQPTPIAVYVRPPAISSGTVDS